MGSEREIESAFGKRKVITIDGGRGGGPESAQCAVWSNRLRPRPLKWFWAGWIMEGGLNFLIGDPAAGKGLFLADLVARITRGAKLPDESKAPRATVLMCAIEENIAGALLPRLIAAGAARRRVAVFTPSAPGDARNGGAFEGLPKGIERLRSQVERTGARLVVFDPLVDFLAAGTDPNNEVAVSEALKPLTRLAEEKSLAIICVRHLNKKSETKGFYRMLGSTAFAQKARVIMQIKQDPERDDSRILSCEKNNYAQKPAALAFRIVNGRNKTPHIEWRGPLDREAEEAAADAEGVTPTKLDEACNQLRALLADGPADAEAVQRAMRATGVADRTRFRAYKKMRVKKEKVSDEKTGEIVKWRLSLP
ncbi:MAG TPA: AAA family ATPase [Candidatus Binataceae bacterium]|nr:AAA family ATPase [Candidatus Binataceae bacterium]